MIDAQLSRYGLIASNIQTLNPGAKVHFVGPSSSTWYGDFIAAFGPDADGGNRAFSSITTALADSNVVADRGDVLLVLPGYTQTVTGAAGISVTKAGLSIIGLGNGAARPTITFSTAVAASFNISAANILVQNLRFVTAIDNQTAVHNVTGADVKFDQCEWTISNGTVGAALGISTAATADRLQVTNCRFVGPATNAGTTCAACIKHEAGVDYLIENNYFAGKMTQAIVNVATILRGSIHNNRFVIGTGTVAITMAAASTPFVTNNRINVPSGTAPIVAAAGFVAGNAYSAAAGVTAGVASTF